MFGYFFSDAAKVSASPLGNVVIDDGRRFLDGTPETYDVIVVDPPPPPKAPGSSLLYSREFYKVAMKHLRPDGILATWYPEAEGDVATAASIANALKSSFPYVYAFESFDGTSGIHFLASKHQLRVDPTTTIAKRMPDQAVADLTEWQPGSTAEQQLQNVLSRVRSVEEIIANDQHVPALEDDQPVNEYYILRSWFHWYR